MKILTDIDRAEIVLTSIVRLSPVIGHRLIKACPDLQGDINQTKVVTVYGVRVAVPVINIKLVAVWEEYAKGN
ncbi:MAG: hypothetical protein PHI12_12945 [Dehalococcoidales bacterium]|nr:hypothetical protein [Dehalococcoidales bacterium]